MLSGSRPRSEATHAPTLPAGGSYLRFTVTTVPPVSSTGFFCGSPGRICDAACAAMLDRLSFSCTVWNDGAPVVVVVLSVVVAWAKASANGGAVAPHFTDNTGLESG